MAIVCRDQVIEVLLVGSVDELGQWDPARGIKAEWSFDNAGYHVCVALPPMTHVEFKCVISLFVFFSRDSDLASAVISRVVSVPFLSSPFSCALCPFFL